MLVSIKEIKQVIRQPYTFPGCYPLYFVCNDGGTLCHQCARKEFRLIVDSTKKNLKDGWNIVEIGVNWEDRDLLCDHCGTHIESAYGED